VECVKLAPTFAKNTILKVDLISDLNMFLPDHIQRYRGNCCWLPHVSPHRPRAPRAFSSEDNRHKKQSDRRPWLHIPFITRGPFTSSPCSSSPCRSNSPCPSSVSTLKNDSDQKQPIGKPWLHPCSSHLFISHVISSCPSSKDGDEPRYRCSTYPSGAFSSSGPHVTISQFEAR
jgi:hypothetical protein